MEHTPTPWRAALESMGNTQTWAVVHICSVWDSPEAEANAAFIVRACNAHDELVAQLTSVLAYLRAEYGGRMADFEMARDISAALAKVNGSTVTA